jgi:hypothetical protein
MNEISEPKRRTQTTTILFLGAFVLGLVIMLGFNRGWLAWHSDQRPIGKLRPIDLIAATSEAKDSTTDPGDADPTNTSAFNPVWPPSDDDQPAGPNSTSATYPNSTPASSSVTGSIPTIDHDHDADD